MMRKKLVVRFSVLIFCLLVFVSGVWVFLLKEQLSVDVLYRTGLFIFVLILVLTVLTVILGLIFTRKTFSSLVELVRQFTELKDSPFTTRLAFPENNEISEAAKAANQVIERLESEIAHALFNVSQEKKHFREEHDLLEVEQKEIYEEKEKLDYVLGRIKDGIILLNRERNIVLLNRAAEEITGYNQNEAFNKRIGEVIKLYDDDSEILTDEYAPLAKTNSLQEDAYSKKRLRLLSSQASEKSVDLVCVRLVLIHRQDLGYMIVFHDLTEERECEKKQANLLSSFVFEMKQPFFLSQQDFLIPIKIPKRAMVPVVLQR